MPDRIAVRPAEPFTDTKQRVAEAVEAARDEILDLSHRIHADPEPAFEEHHASAWVADALRRHGFEVEHPSGSLATAVRATRTGAKGGDGPRIGILAEYDAADRGERGAILRREGLYSSHVVEWRRAAEAGAQAGLAPAARDRRDREIEQLRARAEKAEAELARTRAALDLVGKAHALLETLSESADTPKRSPR